MNKTEAVQKNTYNSVVEIMGKCKQKKGYCLFIHHRKFGRKIVL